jgi:hypothetical protein
MALAQDRRRHVQTAFVSVLIGLAAGACQSSGADTGPLVGDAYTTATDAICADTNDRLEALPSPPEGISPTDWADEVALAFRAETERTGDLFVDNSIRGTHLDFVTTTTELADQYRLLSSTIDTNPDGIGAITTQITELTLGRDELASELGVVECIRGES